MRALFTVLLLIFLSDLYSQEFAKDDVQVIRKNQLTGGINIYNNGYGVNIRRFYIKTVEKKKYWTLNLRNYRHPKEIKLSSDGVQFGGARSFVYGKINYFFQLQPGYGFERTITDRENEKDLVINYNLSFGPSIGLLKPYYLIVDEVFPGNPPYSLITYALFDPNKHGSGNIRERAPFGYGIGETKALVGGYIKSGVNFNYSGDFDEVKNLEVGMMFEVYPERVPVLDNSHNNWLLFSLYLSFNYGRKW